MKLVKNKLDLVFYVEKTVRTHDLFQQGAKLIVGVSGGADSMALLKVLTTLRPRWGLTLLVLYCHHGLRAAADEEEAFVRTWAEKWDCPFRSRRLSVRSLQAEQGFSLEEAARALRYQAFEEVMDQERADRLALAHTANDQAEEVLISLIRGAGLGGLAGMPMKRERYIRPFLQTYREEILRYLEAHNLPFLVDQSNRDQRFLRARVRTHLLPELQQYSPNILNQLNRTSLLLQADEAYLQKETGNLEKVLINYTPSGTTIARTALAALPQAIASRLIQRVLSKTASGLRHIRSSHILSLLRAAQSHRKTGRLPLPQGRWAVWSGDQLRISLRDPEDPKEDDFFYRIQGPGDLIIKETGCKLTFRIITDPNPQIFPLEDKDRVRVALDKITWPLTVRNSRNGDRFRPLGLGGSKKIGRFFRDRKVPGALRSGIPLVLSNQEIVWVAGVEVGEPFRLRPDKKQCLEMGYERQKEV
jgi:tRNA(Ile)-lysidine synthase